MSNNPLLKIRPCESPDVPMVFALIKALAEYENLSDMVTGNEVDLREHLFGDRVYVEAIVAELESKIVGFALFLPNYSTFLTKQGIYLEDLFVLPEYRRRGIGKALLTYLINLAKSRQVGRLEWNVLNWNEPAIKFYQSMGAEILPDWRTCRISNVRGE